MTRDVFSCFIVFQNFAGEEIGAPLHTMIYHNMDLKIGIR